MIITQDTSHRKLKARYVCADISDEEKLWARIRLDEVKRVDNDVYLFDGNMYWIKAP